MNRFIDAVVENVQLDTNIDHDEMLDLFRDVAGSQIQDVYLPCEEGVLDGGSVVLVPRRDAQFDVVLHLFVEGEVSADLPPFDPAHHFPPQSPQPQYFGTC